MACSGRREHDFWVWFSVSLRGFGSISRFLKGLGFRIVYWALKVRQILHLSCCFALYQVIVSGAVSTANDILRFVKCTMLAALVDFQKGAKAATIAARDWLVTHGFIRCGTGTANLQHPFTMCFAPHPTCLVWYDFVFDLDSRPVIPSKCCC